MKDGKKKPKTLISPFVPVVGVGVTALGFMLLRPGPEARAKQLFLRGRPDEALHVIREARGKGSNLRLTELEFDILKDTFLKADAPVQRQIWSEAYDLRVRTTDLPQDKDPLPYMTRNLRDPDALWEPRRETILTDALTPEREALLERLLGDGKPASAAGLLAARLAREGASASVSQRLRLADYYRQCGESAKALAALDPIPENARSVEVRALRIALMKESGDAKAALAALVKELSGAETLTAANLGDLHDCALAAGDPTGADALFVKHLRAHPGDAAARRLRSDLLANAGRAGDAAHELRAATGPKPSDRKDLERLAQLYGWANDVTGLEDVLLRLAVIGDRAAVAKLASVAGVPEDGTLPVALAAAVLSPGREAEILPAAEFLSAIGEYALAVKLYAKHLENHPDDADALSANALILFETGDPEGALASLKRAVALRPDDVPLRRRYAENLMALDRGDDALAQYGIVAAKEPDAENLSVVRRLAQSLGRNEVAADAAETRLAEKFRPEAEDYVIAQNLAKGAGRSSRATEILKAAVAKFPENKTLRLYLATRLSDETNHLRALEVMRLHSGRNSDPEAAALWLDLMLLTDSRADEKAYFADGVPTIAMSSPALRMRAGRVLASLGRYPEALEIQKSLTDEQPSNRDALVDYLMTLSLSGERKEALRLLSERLDDDSPESLKLAASVYSDNADFRRAELKARALLATPGQSTSDNWSMLGDFRVSRGDMRGAKQAYARAYRELQGEPAKESSK